MYVVLKLFLISILLVSCNSTNKKELNISEDAEHYIYLSHTRLETNDSIYNKVYEINFSNFDATLLGGDLAVNTFANDTILRHLDSVFHFRNKATLLSIGNHDSIGNRKFHAVTGKNKYHLFQKNNVSFITLDSQDSLSSIVGRQKEFLFNSLDSISTKNIIILSHKLIFMDRHPVMDSLINSTCNGRKGNCYYCLNPNNFKTEVYPKLLKATEKGKNIFWVGGDLGYKKSTFEYIDKEGITFLGNGVWYPKDDNKVLIFSNLDDEIFYKFVPIDTLIANQGDVKFYTALLSN